RVWRAQAWTPRLLWLLATALAWGQLASAHMSQGMILGTGALGAYLLARLVADALHGGRRTVRSLALIMLLVVAFPIVNLAIVLPRLSSLGHSSLASG